MVHLIGTMNGSCGLVMISVALSEDTNNRYYDQNGGITTPDPERASERVYNSQIGRAR